MKFNTFTKKLLQISTFSLLAAGLAANAATPKDIKYLSKGKTFSGETYYIYVVRCSDGKTRKISSWDNRKNWCTGSNKKGCSKDQLKTAKKVCR